MPSKPHPYRTHWFRYILVLVLALLIAAGAYQYTRPIPAVTAQSSLQLPTVTASNTPLQWPSPGEGAVGAVGYGVLATSGAQTPKPTASVAKLITALAVLQKHPLQQGQQGPTLTLTSSDVTIYQKYVAEDGSVVRVQAGEQLTEYQALQAMMLPSANNMADSLAIWAFGSLSAYATYANQMVTSFGLANTHIGSDASGFLPDTTSTPTDLVTLGMKVMQNAVLTEIVGQPSTTLPVAGTVYNYNSLLGTAGIVGIKTGNSDQAGGVFLFAAKEGFDSTHSVIIVGAVQATPSLHAALADSLPLLSSTVKNFSLAKLVSAGQIVGDYKTPWGSSTPVVAKNNLSAIVWDKATPQPTLTLHSLHAPQPSNTTVGSLQFNSSTRDSTPVVLKSSLPSPSFWWRIFR